MLTHLLLLQARRCSPVTRVTGSSASTRNGVSPRVSTTGSGDASRAILLCPRYVMNFFGGVGLVVVVVEVEGKGRELRPRAETGLSRRIGGWEQSAEAELTQANLDRLWLQPQDQAHDPLGPQGVPRQQRPRRRAPPHAQQDLCRRVRSPLAPSSRYGRWD